MSEHLHYVKVTPGKVYSEDGDHYPADIKFECRGNQDSKCHQYSDCECEYRDDEHENEHPSAVHDDCWLQGWFDAGQGATQYGGEDAEDWDESYIPREMDREGFITACYDFDGFVEWTWAA